MCGENWYSTTGWNYVRVARNKDNAGKLANKLDDAADLCATIGAAGAMGTVGGIAKAYFNSYARWIRYKNNLTSCGIVSDQNKYTKAFKVWTQPEFSNR